ncbi:MAG: nucleotidyl transferase AbiEii/AbiGii toxin family protein [Coriobacteriia bacterium]|nr:nucleotidyl transferase AbiEii/AbiGii toxin family protein [Coriobacteriia bacterium]
MKDSLRFVLSRSPGVAPRHVVREFLQVRLLEAMQHAGAHSYLAFHGGTALRLLYQTPRFSEDLDFSYEPADGAFDFSTLGTSIAHDLRQEAYDVEVAVKTTTVVEKGFVRFKGILHEMGVSPLPDETMLIKLEVDTKPPAGAVLTTTRVPRDYGPPVRVSHHDRATLLAGKVAAVLTREWVKGRDVYDLVWYATNTEWPSPNLAYLQASVRQSGWAGPVVTEANWRSLAWKRLSEDADWREVRRDVERFVQRAGDVELVTPEAVGEALMSGA